MWEGAGISITVDTEKTYNVSLKIKSETEQKFNINIDPVKEGEGDNQVTVHDGVTLNSEDTTVKKEDDWKTITGTLTIPKANEGYDNRTSYSAMFWIQTNADPSSTGDYSIDDIKITYDDSTEADEYAAEVGGTKYTSLDDAIDNANGEKITLLDDATLSKNRTNTDAIIDGQNHKITVELPNGENYSSVFSNLTLSNAKLTGNTNQNIAIKLNLDNVTVEGLSYDCLALVDLTAKDCSLEHNGGVYVFAGNNTDGKFELTDTTIKVNSLGYTGVVFRVQGETYPKFSNVVINGISADSGSKIAKIENDATISGLTVDGMDNEKQELKIVEINNEKILVIAEKAAEFSAAASLDEIKKGTGEFSDTVAAGFKAEVTNTGSARGTFDTTIWNVTSSGETRTTGEKKITAVTLEAGGKAEIYLIVSGLDDKAATATVEVK